MGRGTAYADHRQACVYGCLCGSNQEWQLPNQSEACYSTIGLSTLILSTHLN